MRNRGQGSDKRPGAEAGASGTPPKPPIVIDWEAVRIRSLASLQDRASRYEVVVDGQSLADGVSEMIMMLIERSQLGREIPTGEDELVAVIARAVASRWTNAQRLVRRRSVLLAKDMRNRAPQDVFREIAERDEQKYIFERMYAELNEDAGKLLHLILSVGIPHRETAELAEVLECSWNRIHNLKRQIARLASKILTELDPSDNGDAS